MGVYVCFFVVTNTFITGKVLPVIIISDFQNTGNGYASTDTPNPIYVHLS